MAPAKKHATSQILMPRPKALWMYDNTELTLEQIADFCGLPLADMKAIADDIGPKYRPQSPVMDGDVTHEEIARCEADQNARLQRVVKDDRPAPVVRSKGPRYTPVSKRAEKPNAILFLVKNNPELTDAQIVRLVGTTKNTIKTIRDKTHTDYSNLTPTSPADVGLCTMEEYLKAVEKARKARPQDVIEKEEPRYEKEGVKLEDNAFDFSAFMGTSPRTGTDDEF